MKNADWRNTSAAAAGTEERWEPALRPISYQRMEAAPTAEREMKREAEQEGG
jgi:hypothetical protein